MAKYSNRDPSRYFLSVAVETSGAFSPFFKELGYSVSRAVGENRSFFLPYPMFSCCHPEK